LSVTIELKDFFISQKILICDGSQSIMNTIAKLLNELGAERSNIFATLTFSKAVSYLNEAKPSIVITEYNLRDRYGLELRYIEVLQLKCV
jgi:PleD family two-component response regulator